MIGYMGQVMKENSTFDFVYKNFFCFMPYVRLTKCGHIVSCGASTIAAMRVPTRQGRPTAELSRRMRRKVARICARFDS
jgi:hypothetical protein